MLRAASRDLLQADYGTIRRDSTSIFIIEKLGPLFGVVIFQGGLAWLLGFSRLGLDYEGY